MKFFIYLTLALTNNNFSVLFSSKIDEQPRIWWWLLGDVVQSTGQPMPTREFTAKGRRLMITQEILKYPGRLKEVAPNPVLEWKGMISN